MGVPWASNEEDPGHTIREQESGMFKCIKCKKMATKRDRLNRTPCSG